MKTTKLILVAAIMALSTLGFAQTEPANSNEVHPSPELSIEISLKTALQNPNLVKAMYEQLNPSFLLNEQRVYTVCVRYKGVAYFITGTRKAWQNFFHILPTSPAEA